MRASTAVATTTKTRRANLSGRPRTLSASFFCPVTVVMPTAVAYMSTLKKAMTEPSHDRSLAIATTANSAITNAAKKSPIHLALQLKTY